MSPLGIVTVTPEDIIATPGQNITFEAETDAGPDTYFLWLFDPTFSLCADNLSDCDRIVLNG